MKKNFYVPNSRPMAVPPSDAAVCASQLLVIERKRVARLGRDAHGVTRRGLISLGELFPDLFAELERRYSR